MEPARKFKIIVNSKECGTCSGPTPSAVAKKVVKKLCGTSSKVVKFSLKECKRGCERVCGPYQGRVEKLDRPCKRDGKMITHRVVCGKVRKMRGGRDLTIEDFEKREDDGEFRIEAFQYEFPYVYFGERESNNGKKRYEFVTSIDNMFSEFHIEEIKGEKVQIISLRNKNKNDNIYTRPNVIAELKKLEKYLLKFNRENKIGIIINQLKKKGEYSGLSETNKEKIPETASYFLNHSFPMLLDNIKAIIHVAENAERNSRRQINNNNDEEFMKNLTAHSKIFNKQKYRKMINSGRLIDEEDGI